MVAESPEPSPFPKFKQKLMSNLLKKQPTPKANKVLSLKIDIN